MTTTAENRQAARPGRPLDVPSVAGRVAAARRTVSRTVHETLDRPLASYYLLVGASGLLLVIGLVMVLSSSSVWSYRMYDHNSYAVFLKQLTWVVLAVPFVWVAVRLPHRVLRLVSWPALVVSVVLLAMTQTSMGVTVNGNRNWLALGPVQIQPAELAKLAVIVWCSHIYATKERLLDDWRHTLIPVVPVMTVVVGLVVVGHDLGTALVLLGIVLGLLWVVGAPTKMFVGSLLVASAAALALAASSPERMQRLTSFADPFKSFQGAGWQAAHGILGMSSGGLLGKGIGASQQKWGDLPAAHTDFIFAVLGEELGLVGTLLVLGLFLTVAFAGLRVAQRTTDPFARYMAAGITVWITSQMMINVGMVLALLPVIGIPLPLVSYGGSGLLPSLVALGLLVSFARHEPGAQAALQAKRRKGVTRGVTAGGVSRRSRA
ncbi:MAG: cell division protein FtsW [Nocardioidaceae bacterium]|nr:cell division protein FtsW [Nocardioidaceae bacterium]